MNNQKRNYLLYIGRLSPNFGDQGWSDGYNDLKDDSKEIITQLYGNVEYDDLVEYVSTYLQGYEVGKELSEHIDDVYDEDGDVKENWESRSAIFDYVDETIELVKQHIKKI